MPKLPEYSIVTKKDDYGDDCRFVLRETTTPTGLIITEELGMLNFHDVKEAGAFPEGLIEPTEEEIIQYGGNLKKEDARPHEQDTATYEPASDISQLEHKIAAFVLDGITSGRQPVIAWNDLASDVEIRAFQNAASRVNSSQQIPPLENTTETQNIGLYL